MKYFLNEAERKESKSTCYFEFQNGKYQGNHWLKDSLCLHADKFDEFGLYDLFSRSIKDFNYYGPTEVCKAQWMCLVKKSARNEFWNDIITELMPWAEMCFEKYNCFTICGI